MAAALTAPRILTRGRRARRVRFDSLRQYYGPQYITVYGVVLLAGAFGVAIVAASLSIPAWRGVAGMGAAFAYMVCWRYWLNVAYERLRRRMIDEGRFSYRLSHCWKCRYSLEGLEGPVCPECGSDSTVELREAL